MTEQPFGQETVPPVQDAIPNPTGMAHNVYQQVAGSVTAMDSQHEAMANLARQNSALMAKLALYEKPQDVSVAPPGGAPVAHHLHLVDGRTVVGFDGIGTHYSEVLPDGTTKITRIKEYFPAVEVDPSTLNA